MFKSDGELRAAATRLLWPIERDPYIGTYPEYVETGDLRNGPWALALSRVAEAQRMRRVIAEFWRLFHEDKFTGAKKGETPEEQQYIDGRGDLFTELSIMIGKIMSEP